MFGIGSSLITPISNTLSSGLFGMGQSNNPFTQAASQTAQGNLAGAQQATAANRVSQSTPYGGLQYRQTGTDQFGNPTYSADQSLAPQFQSSFTNLANQVGQTTATPFNASQFAPQTNFQAGSGMEGWDKATNLIMNRLSPQLERQQKSLDTQLANQGIMRGSEAYEQAQQDLAMKQNDLMNQAALAGQQVQQNLFTQNLQAGTAGNQAQQQAYNQALGAYNLPLSQLGAFRTATAPTYVNPYQQAAVAGPDYLGAYSSSEAARIAEMNAEAAKQQALTGGLFQLGSSALSNPTVVSSVLGGAKDLIGGIGDIFGF